MFTLRSMRALFAFVVVFALIGAGAAGALAQDATPDSGTPQAPQLPPMSANVSVFATGLENPRGLKFGPDGALYVAEGGKGGTTSTDGQCEQVVPPVGPYTGGKTARISKIDPSGQRTTIADGLASNQTSPQLGSLVAGVADIAFVGDTLYALIAGGGCSHGHLDAPNGVLRVNPDGTTELVADLSAFVKANPVATPNPGDFEPDEGAYAMTELDGMLYVVESNHGAIDRVDPATGETSRLIDISKTEGHVVPTAIVVGPDGNFYLSNLSTFPAREGVAVVYKLTPDGQLSKYAEGLTAVLGLAFDNQGRLYALETTGAGSPDAPIVPGTGRVVRLTENGELEIIATGLVFPTAMTFGKDGNLYVSNFGFGFSPDAGQIVNIDMSAPLPESSPTA
ncbi:MAG: ScyD/ScyE family protein [Thermomicrobiales bacterium]